MQKAEGRRGTDRDGKLVRGPRPGLKVSWKHIPHLKEVAILSITP